MGTNLDIANALNTVSSDFNIGAQQIFNNDQGLPGHWQIFCDKVPTKTINLNYYLLGPTPLLIEWLGARQKQFLREYDQTMTYKKWEATLPIDVDDLKYLRPEGIVQKKINAFLADNAYVYDKRFFEVLVSNSGAGPTCYDGQAVFSTAHPHAASAGTNSNLGTSALSYANYRAVVLAMQGWTMENGRNYGVNPTHLLVGPKNEEKAKEIVEAKERVIATDAVGAESTPVVDTTTRENIYQGEVTLVVSRELVGSYDDYWYVAGMNKPGVYPFVLQENQAPMPGQRTEYTDPERWEANKYEFGLEADFEVGAGMWQTMYANVL